MSLRPTARSSSLCQDQGELIFCKSLSFLFTKVDCSIFALSVVSCSFFVIFSLWHFPFFLLLSPPHQVTPSSWTSFFFKSSNQFAMFTLTCSSVHLHLAGLIFNPISMRSWELWESENSQGTKYHYVENGSRRQELVLLLHDFSDFWYGWRSQVRAWI